MQDKSCAEARIAAKKIKATLSGLGKAAHEDFSNALSAAIRNSCEALSSQMVSATSSERDGLIQAVETNTSKSPGTGGSLNSPLLESDKKNN